MRNVQTDAVATSARQYVDAIASLPADGPNFVAVRHFLTPIFDNVRSLRATAKYGVTV